MSKKTAIIIDDEHAARTIIRQYLLGYKNITILGECGNGIEAVAAIDKLEPDIIFLDIQMPGMNGFQVLQHVKHIPQVIFTTAYDSFAIKAFEHNAVDYLLKPYTKERFDISVARVQEQKDMHHIRALAEQLQLPDVYPERIFVEAGHKLIGIAVADILYLKADKDYTHLYTADKSYLSTHGISTLEQRLNPQLFTRVHRSYIVNVKQVKELYKDTSRMYLVLSNGTEVSIGRNYLNQIRKFIF